MIEQADEKKNNVDPFLLVESYEEYNGMALELLSDPSIYELTLLDNFSFKSFTDNTFYLYYEKATIESNIFQPNVCDLGLQKVFKNLVCDIDSSLSQRKVSKCSICHPNTLLMANASLCLAGMAKVSDSRGSSYKDLGLSLGGSSYKDLGLSLGGLAIRIWV